MAQRLTFDVIHIIFSILSYPLAIRDESFRSTTLGYDDTFSSRWAQCLYRQAEIEAKEHLTACALVSREWNAITRPHLFSTVALRFSVTSGPRSLEDIDNWLSRSPATTECIKKLRLCMLPLPNDEDHQTDCCSLDTLASVIDRCFNLQAIELLDLTIRYQFQKSKFHPGFIPRPSRSLDLHMFYWERAEHILDTIDDLIGVLCWIGAVDILYMSDFGVVTQGTSNAMYDTLLASEVRTTTQTVYLNNCASWDRFLEAFLRTPILHSERLRTVAVTASEAYSSFQPTIQRILTTEPLSLVELVLDASNQLFNNGSEFALFLRSLSNHHSLRKLVLAMRCCQHRWENRDRWDTYAEFIHQLAPSPTCAPLERIQLIILGMPEPPLHEQLMNRSAALTRMDKAAYQISTLRNFDFAVESPVNEDQVHAIIRDAMPLLQRSGRLGFLPESPY